jgi:hypothetical protein
MKPEIDAPANTGGCFRNENCFIGIKEHGRRRASKFSQKGKGVIRVPAELPNSQFLFFLNGTQNIRAGSDAIPDG